MRCAPWVRAAAVSAKPEPVGVFLVDDDAYLARAMERWMQGVEGLRWAGAAAGTPDVIGKIVSARARVMLMELDVRAEDPFALIRRAQREAPGVRVLVFSGHLNHQMIVQALDAGAVGYISKEGEPHDLLRLIVQGAHGELALCDHATRVLRSVLDE